MNTDAITRDRLEEWRQVLRSAKATPVLMVAVGHEEREGELHVLVPEDLEMPYVRAFLRAALDELRHRDH